ncbi:GNAT family N-acetyltransferase [Salicibibacter kimchii]|uniref:N-acetyltransferase n=1 Tax=Salicibibacter kimchii TaxID=2099786 RepID=A0A345BYF3_9BACI|nr:GNAT family N-acetyltransferase [Salicibibacter kimchii]AXF55984.1 N-acetyltransferase [Salicibibacter kimchii]
MVITTERLIIRGMEKDDANDLYHLFSDPYVTRLDHVDPMTNRQEAEALIRMADRHPDRLLLSIEQ